jgi:flavomodulin
MRKLIFKAVMIASLASMVSCSKSDSESTEPIAKQLANLKQVYFAEEPDQIIPTEGSWTSHSGKALITTRKQIVINPIELVNMKNIDIIYPGSILRGDSFLEGKYDPIIPIKPNEITISTSLQGKGLNVKIKGLPKLSDYRQKINDLLKDNVDKIDYQNTPAYMSLLAQAATSISSFNKALHLHADANIIKRLVTLDFNYKPSEFRINDRNFVVVKVRQPLYNLTVDPQNPEEWGRLNNVGNTEPVYISSVDYGRVAHLLIQTERKFDEVKKIIDGSLEINLAKKVVANGEIKATYDEITKEWFSNGKVVVLIAGGTLDSSRIYDYNTFINYLKSPSAESLIQSAVPISYKVRTLKDNKEVEVRVSYTEEEFK